MKPTEVLVIALGAVGLAWYYLCLFSIGLKPKAPTGALRQFESLSVTTISVSLATFVGGLIGLSQQDGGTVSPTVAAPQSGLVALLSIQNLQWACVALYILSLVIALVFWFREKDNTDPVVSGLGKSLLGLVGGALAIALKPLS
jgi:hypothetical protein